MNTYRQTAWRAQLSSVEARTREARWDDDGGAPASCAGGPRLDSVVATPPSSGALAPWRTTPWRAHAALVLAYTYRFGLTVPGGQASCRVQIYEGGGQTVAIGTQWQDKFGGTALTENAARVATQVAAWHHPQPDDQFIWVEHFAFPRGPDPQGRWETFAFVTFQRGAAGERDQPTWWPTDRAAVEAVLNQALGA
jgi:hypothetical protein